MRADASSIYLHEHEFGAGPRATRRGVFAALRLYPAGAGVVLPHELTFPKAKVDRLELLRATRANTSPIFGMVDGRAMRALDGATAVDAGHASLGDDRHALRRVTDGAAIERFVTALRDRTAWLSSH